MPFCTFSQADKNPTEMSSDKSNIYAQHDAQYCDGSVKLKVLKARLVSPHADNNFITLSLFCFTQHQKKKHGPILLLVPTPRIIIFLAIIIK